MPYAMLCRSPVFANSRIYLWPEFPVESTCPESFRHFSALAGSALLGVPWRSLALLAVLGVARRSLALLAVLGVHRSHHCLQTLLAGFAVLAATTCSHPRQ